MSKVRQTRIISAKQLDKKKYVILEITDEFAQMFGHVERNFRMNCYGPSTSGKSTFALETVMMLADKGKKIGYNSHEEAFNKTLQDRSKETGANKHELIYFLEGMPFEEMMERIGKLRYHVVVIDSTIFMGITYDQWKDLVNKYKRKAFITVGHGDGLNQFDSVHLKNINKACDIKVFCAFGKVTIASRYKTGVHTYKRFDYITPDATISNTQKPEQKKLL